MDDDKLQEYITDKIYHENDDVRSFMIRERARETRKGMELLALSDHKIAFNMRVDEIAQKSFASIIDKKRQIDSVRSSVSYTTAYRCSKCGHQKTSVTYIQTRSSDEPMSAFIQCINCKYIFKK
jgi:DNA-directed RNA polymerase subunit M/transcription elongation factor TFIIS